MREKKSVDAAVPFGLPNQIDGLSTAPSDRGDETQERFRYQAAIGVWLLARSLTGTRSVLAIWCEHHDDFLLELASGRFVAVQVKTDSRENTVWRLADRALIASIARFCELERCHGQQIESYEFISNAPGYVPGETAEKGSSLASSPERLAQCCVEAPSCAALNEPYKGALRTLCLATGAEAELLFEVLRKLRLMHGPVLRGYEDSLAASVIPNLPGCANLLPVACRRLRDELIEFVQGACRLKVEGIDGVVAYLASNGRPEASLRGKCITPQLAEEVIIRAKAPNFRFVGMGGGFEIRGTPGRSEVLQRKMRNAYLSGQFESMRMRMDSAEERLMERAGLEPETFDAIADQIIGAVLVESKDIEAMHFNEGSEKTRGPTIFREILKRMEHLAVNDPARVAHEPKDTLIGVAGMLSGECKFAWGAPLEESDDGA